MKKYAVIDIGSNSVRLMFVVDGNVLYKRLQTTRLGENLAQTGELSTEAIARSAKAVAVFYAQAIEQGAQTVLAFATAAVRGAKNGADFIKAVQTLCPLTVEVISGETEAEIGILGAIANKDGAVLDIGGASTELVVQRLQKSVYKKSIKVGVVRLKDTCGYNQKALEIECEKKVLGFQDAPSIESVYAIGGTATTVAFLLSGEINYVAERITGMQIHLEQVQALRDKLARMSVEEIANVPGVPTGRADVIFGGVVWLITIMKALNVDKVIVSDRDNLEGYALKKGLKV